MSKQEYSAKQIITDNSPYIVQLINNRICRISVAFDKIRPENFEKIVDNTINNDFAGFEFILQEVFVSDNRIGMRSLSKEEKQEIKEIKENIVFNLKKYYKDKIGRILEDVALDVKTETDEEYETLLENNVLDFDPFITKNEFCKMVE